MEIDLEKKVARIFKTHSAKDQDSTNGDKTMLAIDLDFNGANELEMVIGYLEWFTIHRLRKYGPTGSMADIDCEKLVEEYHGKMFKVEEFEPPPSSGKRLPTKAGVESSLDKLSEEEQLEILKALQAKLKAKK